MTPIDPESPVIDPAGSEPGEDALHPAPPVAEPIPTGPGWLLALACAAGLAAGLISTLAGEAILDLVQPITSRSRLEYMQRWRDAQVYSAVWTFTSTGGLLGLAMGLAGGLARRSGASGVRAAIVGLLLGTGAAAASSRFFVGEFFKRLDPHSSDLVLPLLTHCAIWSGVGAIGGLAFGMGLGGKGRWLVAALGGLVGAAAGSVLYEIVGALAFASSRTDHPVSSAVLTRAIAQVLLAMSTAIGAVVALRQAPRPADSTSATP